MTLQEREKVREFIFATALRILTRRKRRTLEELRQAMPFHLLFFGDEGIVAAADQRSIVTSMGQVLYPGLAKVVAELKYKQVVLGRKRSDSAIKGELNEAQCAAIDNILNDLYAKKRQPDHTTEIKEILGARGSSARPVEVLPDLYIGDFKPGPLFIELKSPIANLDVCAESKRKVLTYLALMHNQGRAGAQAFLGFTYNPYVRRGDFKHWPVLQMMDMGKQLLIGEELWDKIGGAGTFRAIVEIIQDVRKDLISALKKAAKRK
jgi:Type II restriction endonuclease, TdeIII